MKARSVTPVPMPPDNIHVLTPIEWAPVCFGHDLALKRAKRNAAEQLEKKFAAVVSS